MALETPHTALLNVVPVPVNMAARKYGVSLEPSVHLAFLVQPKQPISMPAPKYDQQRANRGKHALWVLKKGLFEEGAIFLSLMGETTKRHGFLYIGAHLAAKGVLGHMAPARPPAHPEACWYY